MSGPGRARARRCVGAALAGTLVMSSCAGVIAGLWATGRIGPVGAARWVAVTATAEATPRPGAPVFLLAIGNDERPGVSGARGDALHLIGVNPGTGDATILNIPRDTVVAIPGRGRDRINLANARGGPRLSAQTVGAMVGVDVTYAVETDFDGFVGMVDELGGLVVDVPEPMYDRASGAHFDPGPQRLAGRDALAYARNRHQFPTGDLRRTENQGYLLISALAQLRAEGTGPLRTLRLIGTLVRHTHLEGLGLGDLYRLGRLAMTVDPARVRNVVLPVAPAGGGGLVPGAAARSLFADFADDAILQSH